MSTDTLSDDLSDAADTTPHLWRRGESPDNHRDTDDDSSHGFVSSDSFVESMSALITWHRVRFRAMELQPVNKPQVPELLERDRRPYVINFHKLYAIVLRESIFPYSYGWFSYRINCSGDIAEHHVLCATSAKHGVLTTIWRIFLVSSSTGQGTLVLNQMMPLWHRLGQYNMRNVFPTACPHFAYDEDYILWKFLTRQISDKKRRPRAFPPGPSPLRQAISVDDDRRLSSPLGLAHKRVRRS